MGRESYTKGKAEQRAVADLYRLAGLWVYELGRPGLAAGRRGHRGTMQTPGLPDLLALGPGVCVWHEVKAGPKARLSLPQRIFRVRWAAAFAVSIATDRVLRVRALVGDVEVAREFLRECGLLDECGVLHPLRFDPADVLTAEALRRKRR